MGEEGNSGWEMGNYFKDRWKEELVQIIKMSTTDKKVLDVMAKLAAYVDGYYKNLGTGKKKKKRKTPTKTTNKTKADLVAELKLLSETNKGLQYALTKSKKQIKDLRAKIKKNKRTRGEMNERISKLEQENKELSEYYDRFDIMDL